MSKEDDVFIGQARGGGVACIGRSITRIRSTGACDTEMRKVKEASEDEAVDSSSRLGWPVVIVKRRLPRSFREPRMGFQA